MKLNYSLFLFIFGFCFYFPHESHSAYSELPKLSTKQDLNKIRFISSDGAYTYYQKNDGSLVLSHNYSLKEVLKGPSSSQFFIFSSKWRKKLLITMNPFYFNENSLMATQMVYFVNFGSSKASSLGKGINPILHLEDSWASLYDPSKKNIMFYSLEKKISFVVNIHSYTNPYFVPENILISPQELLYTDIDHLGTQGILSLDRNTKKITLVYKSSTPGTKIELCLNDKSLLIGEFPYPGIKGGSKISILNLSKHKDFQKRETIYESESQDFGSIICNTAGDYLYFLKTTSKKDLPIGSETDVFKLEYPSKKLTKVSDLSFVTQLLNLDGIIIIPYRGEYFVIEGNSKLNQDQLTKEKKE